MSRDRSTPWAATVSCGPAASGRSGRGPGAGWRGDPVDREIRPERTKDDNA